MKRVLLVAFFFPPTNVVGSIRPAKFAKFLPEFGWEPTVLTVDRFSTRPETMPSPIAPERVVRCTYVDPLGFLIRRLRSSNASDSNAAESKPGWRTRIYSLARRILDVNVVRMPDRALTWYWPAVTKGLQVLAQQHFDMILSSSPPPTVNLVASSLSRRTGVPWVADFRDLWTFNHSFHRSQPWQSYEESLEKRVVRPASLLLTVSSNLASKLGSFHGKPTDVITNGFDSDLAPLSVATSPKLTITYTGSLYAGKQDPSPLFEALRRFRETGRLAIGELEVRFWGNDMGNLEALVDKYKVRDMVSCYGPVTYMESLQYQCESAALLFLDWNDPLEPGIYSLKVMEYLGARRPVLGIGQRQNSLVDQLLVSCDVGRVLCSLEQIETQLLDWLDEYRSKGELSYHGNSAEIEKYSCRTLTGRLAETLTRVAKNP